MEHYVHTEAQKEGAKELQELQEKMQQMIFDFIQKHKEYMCCRVEQGEYGTLKLVPSYRIKVGQ